MEELFKKTVALLKSNVPRAKRAKIFNELHTQLIHQIEGLGQKEKEAANEKLKNIQSIAHQLFIGPALHG